MNNANESIADLKLFIRRREYRLEQMLGAALEYPLYTPLASEELKNPAQPEYVVHPKTIDDLIPEIIARLNDAQVELKALKKPKRKYTRSKRKPTCGITGPNQFVCTLEPGHAGPHKATDWSDNLFDTWH